MSLTDVLWLLALIPVAFVQNMVFTAVSRSRNSGDPNYHRWWAYGSNGIWLICQFFIWKHFWAAFTDADYLAMAFMAVIYTISTAEGSVYMMKKMVKKETGKRKVGADEEREKQMQSMTTQMQVMASHLEKSEAYITDLQYKVARLSARVDMST